MHNVFATEIVDFRLSNSADRTRLVFDLDSPVEHSLFTLKGPDRVVVDIQNVALATSLPTKINNSSILRGIRNAPRQQNGLRVVLDLKDAVRPKSFLLQPAGAGAGHRLVIDLFEERKQKPNKVKKTLPKANDLRDVIIAIDAGHGGKDPGAIGPKGTYEKQVVLAIAKSLAEQIRKERGMQPLLVREGDYFMGLRERIKKARKHKADLFISIHADAFKNIHARGSSVYALSLRGASSEAAQWLANRENAAELIGGVSLNDKDDVVASVLLDLSQTATIQASVDLGAAILQQMSRHNKLHKSTVQHAGFMVLKSPDIPSVLIETAFISNPAEERKLRDKRHQLKTAKDILQGVRTYFKTNAPPGTLLAHENLKSQGLAMLKP